MDLIIPEGESVVINPTRHEDTVLRVVVTDAATEIALALLYRILSDNIFGENQSVFVSLYESQEKAVFLESVVIELTSFSPNLLHGIIYTHDISIAFKDADIVFALGSARGYEFSEDEYEELFFKEYALTAKLYGQAVEKYAKKDVKVISFGITAATVMSRYVKSISVNNITALSVFNWRLCKAHIAEQVNCLPDEVKNLIIWGSDNKYTFPDCRYISFTDGTTVTDDLNVWLRNDLPRIIQSITNRAIYTRSLAYGLAEHCKFLWNGTPKGEWICMSVLSDHSYGVRPGIFFSYPVFCRDKNYQIVQGLADDEYLQKIRLVLSKLIRREAHLALKICGLN